MLLMLLMFPLGIFFIIIIWSANRISHIEYNALFNLESSTLPTESLSSKDLEHIHTIETAFLQEGFTFMGDYLFLAYPKPLPYPVYRKYYIHTPTQSLGSIGIPLIYDISTGQTTTSISSDIVCVFENNYEVSASTLSPPHLTSRNGIFLFWVDNMSFIDWVKEFMKTVAHTSTALPFSSFLATNDVLYYLRLHYKQIYNLYKQQKKMTYNNHTQCYSFTFLAAIHIFLLSLYYQCYKIPSLRKQGYKVVSPTIPTPQPISTPQKIVLQVIIFIILLTIILFIGLHK